MTKYIVFSVIVTALIYLNVFGLYMGIKDIPKGSYKEALWKYKKMEILEKSVICLFLVGIIISMYFTDETAAITLIAMVFMVPLEYLFARYVRKNLVCPHCGGPVWTGRYLVFIRPRKYCAHCGNSLYGPASEEKSEDND